MRFEFVTNVIVTVFNSSDPMIIYNQCFTCDDLTKVAALSIHISIRNKFHFNRKFKYSHPENIFTITSIFERCINVSVSEVVQKSIKVSTGHMNRHITVMRQ